MADRQRLHQAVCDGLQHVVDAFAGIQFPDEIYQGLAVIVGVAVEMAIQLFLYPVADGLEQEGGDEHHHNQLRTGNILNALLDQVADGKDNAVEGCEDDEGGQRVGVAPAEDNVHIHQPVAQNGPRDGEGDEGQRDDRVVQQRAELEVQDVRNGIQQPERCKAEDHAVPQPLQLLANHSVLGLAITLLQHETADGPGQCEQAHPRPIQ